MRGVPELTFLFGLLVVVVRGWGVELRWRGIMGDMVIGQKFHSI